jgi:nicotinamidase/pyrazinamidase
LVNELIPGFDLVVATQDWHPPDHGSFASNHSGRAIFEEIELHGLPQTLWPDHCVQNTGGACFAPGLQTRGIRRIFQKGADATIDSYSGFFDNGYRKSTGLAEWLRSQQVRQLWLAGLATDYCVKFTALDALKEGFTVHLIEDACRGVNLQAGDVGRATDVMAREGVRVVQSARV